MENSSAISNSLENHEIDDEKDLRGTERNEPLQKYSERIIEDNESN